MNRLNVLSILSVQESVNAAQDKIYCKVFKTKEAMQYLKERKNACNRGIAVLLRRSELAKENSKSLSKKLKKKRHILLLRISRAQYYLNELRKTYSEYKKYLEKRKNSDILI